MESFDDDLKLKLRRLCRIWNGRVRRYEIDRWLQNFRSPEQDQGREHRHASYLLSQFMYFGEKELRELLRCLFYSHRHLLITEVRHRNGDTLDRAIIEPEVARELAETVFVGVGSSSESGTHLLYLLRQESELNIEHFRSQAELAEQIRNTKKRPDFVRSYVFVDDVCGSGEQVLRYVARKLLPSLRERAPGAKIYYYVLFGTAAGLKRVREANIFTLVEAIYELDESFRCFGSGSRYEPTEPHELEKVDWQFLESMCRRYGKKIRRSAPMGFGEAQLLLATHLNPPNNTLPVFWSDNKWYPLFRRASKKAGGPK